ncbi:peptidoglycan-binding protein [Candidatus Nomurabacteria bacterium]|nr:peptidoglycan-binding protein [Candidatus Nomurabacteria bacterium]
MNTGKIIGLSVLVLGLFGVSAVSAQYYNQYGYQYPAPQYSYQYPTAYAPTAVCPNLYTNLTVGMSGAQVTELQQFLATRGYNQLVTGYYGSLTSANVAQFQREQGVSPATGGVGPLTRAAIQRTCGQGGYTPGYPTTPGQVGETFRLDREFDLYQGQTIRERNGELTIVLNQIGGGYAWYYGNSRNDDEVRITVSESCRPGTYCLWNRQETFVLEEGDSEDFGDYEIEVTEIRSNRASFIVRDEDGDNDDDGTVNVTSPSGSRTYEQGDELEIKWTVTDEPRNSSVIIDLYDEDDDFVGTIAIEDADEESYEWDIPERRDYCTQQYPNGLCGYDLDGEFYIKVTLVDDYYGYRDEIDEDDSVTFEIED